MTNKNKRLGSFKKEDLDQYKLNSSYKGNVLYNGEHLKNGLAEHIKVRIDVPREIVQKLVNHFEKR